MLHGIAREETSEIVASVKNFSELGAAIKRPIKTFSDGMKVRLLFATYTSFKADILVLDEAIGAGDAKFFKKAKKRAREFYARSKTFIMATHAEPLAKEFCTRGLVFSNGKLVFDGEINDAYEFYRE